ncbi:MAG: MATE family efflux transporter [Tannerellaceae bacterium]|jgi:putative MATE family efflux protein|nr:MATE family efflux transporter [Tannerellaceae bacterium]
MLTSRDLTSGPISRQLFRLAAPIIGTSFIQMTYSLTDMAWVGRLGSASVAAIGSVGILTWLTTNISLLTKVASEVSVGMSLGSRSQSDARMYATHNFTIALLLSLIWGSSMFALAQPVLGLYRLSEGITSEAVVYLRIVAIGFPFVFLSSALTGIYNGAGLSRIPFYIHGAGLILNITLDPVCIFVFDMGSAGAAIATIISQASVFVIFIYTTKRKSRLLGGFPLLGKLRAMPTLRIFRLGLPVAMFNSLHSIINLLMGRTASLHGGHIGLMTLTAGGQIEALAWNTSQGFSTALGSFVAQNHAAGMRDRVHGAYRTTLLMTMIFGIFCTLLFVFFGEEIFAVIVPEREAWMAGGLFLRIDGYSMMLMMLEITMQGLFYGTGRTIPPAIISISLNLARLPLAALLASTSLGVEGVWWALSLTSMGKGAAAFLYWKLSSKS